jgi:hypothetical protein
MATSDLKQRSLQATETSDLFFWPATEKATPATCDNKKGETQNEKQSKKTKQAQHRSAPL